jgi:hypothetical protein
MTPQELQAEVDKIPIRCAHCKVWVFMPGGDAIVIATGGAASF